MNVSHKESIWRPSSVLHSGPGTAFVSVQFLRGSWCSSAAHQLAAGNMKCKYTEDGWDDILLHTPPPTSQSPPSRPVYTLHVQHFKYVADFLFRSQCFSSVRFFNVIL